MAIPTNMATAGHPASPGAAKALTALKQALHGLQSGQTLVQLVQGAPNNGELASAVCACMQEACGELIAVWYRSPALQAPSKSAAWPASLPVCCRKSTHAH